MMIVGWNDSVNSSCDVIPSSATRSTGTCCCSAMKPRIEKTTKPANKLVAQLMTVTITASLHADIHRGRQTDRDRYIERLVAQLITVTITASLHTDRQTYKQTAGVKQGWGG